MAEKEPLLEEAESTSGKSRKQATRPADRIRSTRDQNHFNSQQIQDFHDIVKRGRVGAVKKQLHKAGDHAAELVAAKLDWRGNALYVAAHGGHVAVVELLLVSLGDGAAEAIEDEESAWVDTPLGVSVDDNHVAVSELLLRHSHKGAAAEALDERPLELLVRDGQTAMLELLLHHAGGDWTKEIASQEALHSAASKGHAAVVELLLGHAGDKAEKLKAERDKINHETPFLLAVKGDHVLTARKLVHRSLDVEELLSALGRPGVLPSAVLRDMVESLDLKESQCELGEELLTRRFPRSITRVTREDFTKVGFLKDPVQPVEAWMCKVECVVRKDVLVLLWKSTDQTLATPLARAIITDAWGRVELVYLIDLSVEAIALLSLVRFVNGMRSDDTIYYGPFVILGASVVKEILEEFMELRQEETRWDPSNVFDVARILCFPPLVVGDLFWGAHWIHWIPHWRRSLRALFAFWAAWRWMRPLFLLRGIPLIGKRVLPILEALRDTVGFALVLGFFLAASTQAYYAIGVRSDPGGPFFASFIRVYRLAVMGDFELFDLEATDQTWVPDDDFILSPVDPDETADFWVVQAFFLITSFVVSVTLMNLFIAVLGSNYDRWEDKGEALFARARARIILHYCAFPFISQRVFMDARDEQPCLAFLSPPEGQVAGEERSLRTVLERKVSALETSLKNTMEKMGNTMEKMGKAMERVLDKVSDMEKKMPMSPGTRS